jgi:hypothetical protein
MIADIVGAEEHDRALMAPKLLSRSRAIAGNMSAEAVFEVRAVAAQIGWLETCIPVVGCPLFDPLIGDRQQGRGHGDTERFRSFLIDHQSKFARLFDREIARLGALQDFRRIDASFTHTVARVGCIGCAFR